MLMEFKILNWNVAGAKYLEEKENPRAKFRERINYELRRLLDLYSPHVVTLQEIVLYGEAKTDLIVPPDDYDYHSFPLIDTESLSVRAKWNKIENLGGWPKGSYFAQGNGFLFKKGVPHQPLWALPRNDHPKSGIRRRNYVEKVGLESGLYFGDRDTEPRAALVAHFVFNPDGAKPLDVFVLNIHLTTLTMEREGVPEIDRRATRIRSGQLDIIFDGIISRYNSWRRNGFRERGDHRHTEEWETLDRHEPVWILAGDFNSTPGSVEYNTIKALNFLDVVSNKGAGTKAPGAGREATLILDYIFAGPAFIALDPLITEAGIRGNSVHDIRVSDHFPMTAAIPIWGKLARPRHLE